MIKILWRIFRDIVGNLDNAFKSMIEAVDSRYVSQVSQRELVSLPWVCQPAMFGFNRSNDLFMRLGGGYSSMVGRQDNDCHDD